VQQQTLQGGRVVRREPAGRGDETKTRAGLHEAKRVIDEKGKEVGLLLGTDAHIYGGPE
jgi:hypothetical protein